MKTFKEKMLEDAAAVATNTTAGVASLNAADPTNPPVFKNKQKPILKKIIRRKEPK